MTMTAEQLAQTIRPDLEMLCSSEELTAERREALARIVEHLTPPNLLALLDELERKDKHAERLDFTYMNALELPDDASRNDILAGIHALRYSLNAANKRIAELEARTVTVKLPAHKYRECVNGLLEEAIAYAGTQQLRERISSRLANFVQPDHPHTRCSAGINLTVEG